MCINSLIVPTSRRFNTASGMDCMQYLDSRYNEALKKFQYRKRYGLHAITHISLGVQGELGFNTASGMDCMQCCLQYSLLSRVHVSIPQAVWIACNFLALGVLIWRTQTFQYRKRYGLHAILSPGSLGNSEPKSRFSNTDPLFAVFPKVRGTILSRKVLRKGVEGSQIKGTFLHERNLILMAFPPNFHASSEQSISQELPSCQ